MDVVFLSRLQFAITIMFHYLFPPLTIGLSVLMVMAEGWYLKTKDLRYLSIARFWTHLFAINFALGVATGIVNQFQFGTNWATYSRFVGDVFGTALASEGIFAFFLETGFMGVVVFGWNRVSPRLHFFSTFMVMFGGIFSSIWIVLANSFMQTPAGVKIVGEGPHARAEVTDFYAMVFNPSFTIRLTHVLLAAFVLGAFFTMAVGAYYVARKRFLETSKSMVSLSLYFAALTTTMILFSGDTHAREVAQYQPGKLAAFEGHFVTETTPTQLYLIGFPNVKERKVNFGIYIPRLLTFLCYRNFTQPVPGLDKIPEADWPPVILCFASFHLMAGLGTYMFGVAWLGVFLHRKRKLYDKRWMMGLFMLGLPSAYAANEAGWVAAEVGRQPWVVQGMLRTSQANSHSVPAEQVLISIVMFSCVYAVMGVLWLYALHRKIQHGPEDPATLQLGPRTSMDGILESAAERQDPLQSRVTEEAK